MSTLPKIVKDRHNLNTWLKNASKVVRENMSPE